MASRLRAQEPSVTLDDALRLATTANAHLPVAAINADILRARLREQLARNKPGISLDGDAHVGGPAAYTSSDARLQLLLADTLFDGGRVRASVTNVRRLTRAAEAGYRVVQKDLALDVRLRFADGLHAQRSMEIRQASADRLRSFLTLVEAQAAGGLGVTGDLLRTRTRLAAEQANIADAERALDEALVELNNLMGREPREPLTLAPMPVPPVPLTAEGRPWSAVPDIVQAEASASAAQAALGVERADRRPQIAVTADLGRQQPIGGAAPGMGLNVGRGNGAELTLWFNWPIFDFGAYRSRLLQTELAARQASDSATVVRRQSELEWVRAMEQMGDFYRVLQLRAASVPVARDSYLNAESLYRGGVGTALDVVDAYAAWVDAQIGEQDAIRDYRQAEAHLIRWGTP